MGETWECNSPRSNKANYEAQQPNPLRAQVPQVLAAVREDLVQPARPQEVEARCAPQKGSGHCPPPCGWMCAPSRTPPDCEVQLQDSHWSWFLCRRDQGCQALEARSQVPGHFCRLSSPQQVCRGQAAQRTAPPRVQGQPGGVPTKRQGRQEGLED